MARDEDEDGRRWRRRSAFQRPLHPAQVLVAGVTLEAGATFFVLSVRELPPPERCTCTLLFGAQLLVVVLLFVLISLWDPALPAATRQQQQQQPLAASSPDAFLRRPPSAECAQCRAAVTPDSHHCHACGKCVAGYDHHCVYLNTCIGARNYPLFVGLLSCAVLLFATYMVVSCYALSRLRTVGVSATGKLSSPTARIVLLCVLSLPPLLQLVFMLVLGAFHVYFWVRGISTYEFLHQRRERGSDSTSSSSGAKSPAPTKQQTMAILVTEHARQTNESAACIPSECEQRHPV